MFNFTTTTLFNNTVWDGQKDAVWSVQPEDEDKGTPASLNIKGVGVFKVPNIVAVYKKEGSEGTIGNFSIALPTDLEEGDRLRLEFTIALSQIDNDALYSNDFSYKGKKFYIDFTYSDSASETAKAVEQIVKDTQINVYNRKLWNLEADGTSIKVTGVTTSQRFRDIRLEKIEFLKDYGIEETKKVKTDVEFEDGVDDFMTSDWVLRNLRLPTHAHTRFAAEHKHENPIEGAIYDQYTIHYCAKRGQLGLNAVGQEVTSTTTHVLIVKNDISAKLDECLMEAGIEVTEV